MNHIQTYDILIPIVVGLAAITIGSLVKEPTRQKLMAIILAGASGTYFNDGLGVYEFPLSRRDSSECIYRTSLLSGNWRRLAAAHDI